MIIYLYLSASVGFQSSQRSLYLEMFIKGFQQLWICVLFAQKEYEFLWMIQKFLSNQSLGLCSNTYTSCIAKKYINVAGLTKIFVRFLWQKRSNSIFVWKLNYKFTSLGAKWPFLHHTFNNWCPNSSKAFTLLSFLIKKYPKQFLNIHWVRGR